MGNISKSVLASLNRELADLSRSLSHSDTSMAVKQASNALADLPKDLDGYRVSKTSRDLTANSIIFRCLGSISHR